MTTAADETAEVSAASSSILFQVIHENDLEAAFKILQDALGIKSGDVAALHCQKNGVIKEVWSHMPAHLRAEFIADYVSIEATYSQ